MYQQVDKRGETALHKACSYNGSDYSVNWKNESSAYPECLDMLLSNIDDIATINLKNNNGDTALHNACYSENHIAVKKLLKIQGIDLTIFNKCGDTPIFYVIQDNYSMKFKCPQCLRLLLNHNACLIFARDRGGFRLLDLARNKFDNCFKKNYCSFTVYPEHTRNKLKNDLIELITELEDYMAKARWQIYQEIYKSSLVSYASSSVK